MEITPERHELAQRDQLIAVLLACLMGFAVYQLSSRLPPRLTHEYDYWYAADTARVYQDMTDRNSDQWRSNVHALFPMIGFVPTFVVRKLLGLPPIVAVLAVHTMVAALWAGSLFLLLRVILDRWVAVLLAVIASLSSASLTGFAAPELYPFGSLFLIWTAIVVARRSTFGFLATAVLNAGITVTNGMFAGIAAVAAWPLRRAIKLLTVSVVLFGLLWGAQKTVFRNARFFLDVSGEKEWVLPADSGGPMAAIRAFFLHTLVSPQTVTIPGEGNVPRLSVQRSQAGSGGLFGIVSTALWLILLGLGLQASITARRDGGLRLFVAAGLAVELILHLAYGEETILYSLHFLPLFIVLAAFAFRGSYRRVACWTAGMLAPCLAVNNLLQLRESVALLYSLLK